MSNYINCIGPENNTEVNYNNVDGAETNNMLSMSSLASDFGYAKYCIGVFFKDGATRKFVYQFVVGVEQAPININGISVTYAAMIGSAEPTFTAKTTYHNNGYELVSTTQFPRYNAANGYTYYTLWRKLVRSTGGSGIHGWYSEDP